MTQINVIEGRLQPLNVWGCCKVNLVCGHVLNQYLFYCHCSNKSLYYLFSV